MKALDNRWTGTAAIALVVFVGWLTFRAGFGFRPGLDPNLMLALWLVLVALLSAHYSGGDVTRKVVVGLVGAAAGAAVLYVLSGGYACLYADPHADYPVCYIPLPHSLVGALRP